MAMRSRSWLLPRVRAGDGSSQRAGQGKEPHEASATEAWEEAGVRGKAGKTPVGPYTYLKELDDGKVVPCVVELFQVEVREIKAGFKEQGQRLIDWVSPDEAARRVREIELKSLLVNFKPLDKQARRRK